ncbi:protein ROOT PRIMORDIUM DEFECTIVE 1 [Diospyros lotus]|uniref:protein ROOT PRIMORDIUM DEFECTIVE 1 n=1 Tax=Diospyros lotus TaxID=55363 RepID=UPI00224DE450|nr:protein ROOT PRIMORDIUM DEFECTIVE 1 [Diospyros lotus]XP_052184878.1 protein ROOT PRIMORDIUM DEFECTIVE 1 [Diospyros lotus]XP_052184879.1 protein ROOT PRIMORDIUM DEFECTIVE 1 [Diospyros lotus]XP_052184880.1 protein ROOT PRIMORDIUM DEFECTIVE 1 [Diospyros lotus]
MATHFVKKVAAKLPTKAPPIAAAAAAAAFRSKTTSSQYVASRARDPTFEKLMDKYKNLLKVVAVQDLILASPANPPSVSLDFLRRLSQKLHLNRGAPAFLRRYPHIFDVFYHPSKSQPFCRLTPAAADISQEEAAAIAASSRATIDRLVRILSMSASKSIPLRAIFKVWRELGLPDNFEDSVISQNPNLFELREGNETNTHILKLVGEIPSSNLLTAVENWRVMECCREDSEVDGSEIRFSFKHGYPPGMRLSKNFRAKVKEWQRFPYIGPYEEAGKKNSSKSGRMGLEKRAVGIVHEFLSLTVEKMVEVEKISHFRSWFGIDLNIRDLFLDHPGIFYLSTKGKRHTVFLREAYEKGCLIKPNPVYNTRRKLLDLVVLGRRGLFNCDLKLRDAGSNQEQGRKEEDREG